MESVHVVAAMSIIFLFAVSTVCIKVLWLEYYPISWIGSVINHVKMKSPNEGPGSLFSKNNE